MARPRKPSRPFQRLQREFAAHLRDPRNHPPPPGIESRRMKIYRDLFYNNIEGFLANAFPVLRKITPDRRWHAMVRDFYSRHESHQPLFHRIAEEFLAYLEQGRGTVRGDPPFLMELAHYEWVELALAVATTELDSVPADRKGALLHSIPVVSPLAWALDCRFPVHRIGPEFQPKRPAAHATHLLVWRDRQDQVNFLETNPVTARLMQLLAAGRWTGRQMFERIARELRHPQPDAVVQEGAKLLQMLHERDVVLGTRRPAARGKAKTKRRHAA